MRKSVLLALFAAALAGGCAMDVERPSGPPPGPDGIFGEEMDTTQDEEEIRARYGAMFRAMVAKDIEAMDELHDEAFVLVHMTGSRMDKAEYLAAVRDGTLNYYAAEHDGLSVSVDGDAAALRARSRVTAAVYGGGRHTWRLQQDMELRRVGGVWKFTHSKASTY